MDENPTPCTLFNHVHFGRQAPRAPYDITWAPFPRLPAELRRQIWLSCLRKHRMIELDIYATAEDNDQSQHYTIRNHLGNIVSGRDYSLSFSGSYSAYLSPLLWVNSEARQTALTFYQIHLPLPGPSGGRVLHLSREYDVLFIWPSPFRLNTGGHHPGTLLVDFLHDVKAHCHKGQGVAHLALRSYRLHDALFADTMLLKTTILHPTAAESFHDILHRRLRSLFCLTIFRYMSRGMGEFPVANWYYHFAQNFPLARCGRHPPDGTFEWLQMDPRPGLEHDTRQVPLAGDPRSSLRGWKQLQRAFETANTTDERQAAAREEDDLGCRFYICPSMHWPVQQQQLLQPTDSGTNFPASPPEEERSREELARHLQWEADDWYWQRAELQGLAGGDHILPRHGEVVDAETFEMMEKTPCTALGMWIFPEEAFKRGPTLPQRFCYDLSEARPGLFLWEV